MSKSRIIVLGGSFNPPTIAHLKLMQAAIEQLSDHGTVSDVRGVFVPSSDAYVRRKMTKKPDTEDHSVLPEKLRYDMLDSFREKDCRLHVDGRELGTTNVKGHTVDTLIAIQQENPDAEVFFIFGGDKLEGLPHWSSYEALVSRFRVILFERGDQDAKKFIREKPELAKHENAFLVLPKPDGLEGISSTTVREKVRSGELADAMLTPEVYTMLLASLKKKENIVLCFQGEYRFLSNFYQAQFDWDFWPYWTSAEAAFQSAKCRNKADREKFTSFHVTPDMAKKMGRQVELRQDWEQVKDTVMESIVHEKFFQVEPLARKLMATGNMELVEGNTWGDMYWGVDLHTMKGQNKLGKILMKVRNELLAIPPEQFRFKVKSPYVDAWGNDDVMDMVSESWKSQEKKE